MTDLRTRRLRAAAALEAAGLDGLLLCPGADMLYLTGFEHGHAGERLLAYVLSARGSGEWIVPAMNEVQLRPHAVGDAVAAWNDSTGYRPALVAALARLGAGHVRLAFDEEARAAFLLDVLAEGAIPTPSGSILRGLRLRKTPDELAHLRAAAATVDSSISAAVALCRPGVTEGEIDQSLRALLRQAGPGDPVAFTIVASGPHSALPHHDTGDRPLQAGDVVILDFGTRHEGYHSDITVTCAIGEPADPDVRRVYRAVWEAQQRALEAIRPGVPCSAIDAAARGSLQAAGFGDFFIHRTGHGLGLQVHEPPYLHAASDELLEEGMVFSVEPGVYLAGRFGVRLEVIASVGAAGVDLINSPSSPDLLVV